MASEKIRIRAFEKQRDGARVEELERRCEVGPRGSSFLFTDMMGDPICRIRNSPLYTMLVAEVQNQLVGVVRGSIKTVTACCTGSLNVHTKVGYVLGLRVSPLHRRRGIGLSLVQRLEEWFKANRAAYAYMATEKDNEASVKLFTDKLSYIKFRTPAILVNPVGRHPKPLTSRARIAKLKWEQAELLYRCFMGSTEFFPDDIDTVLRNKLSLGTWVAYSRDESWDGIEKDAGSLLSGRPRSWAVLSAWNSGEVFKLKLEKAPTALLLYSKSSGIVDRAFPCFRVPALPDIFRSFGFYFMYGLHGEGPKSGSLLRTLCWWVHNLATKSRDCKVIVTELGSCDSLLPHIPHWKRLSCPEDLWCVKALLNADEGDDDDGRQFDWTKTQPPQSLFVDPREMMRLRPALLYLRGPHSPELFRFVPSHRQLEYIPKAARVSPLDVNHVGFGLNWGSSHLARPSDDGQIKKQN